MSFLIGGMKLILTWLIVISVVAVIVNYTWETLEHTGWLFFVFCGTLIPGGNSVVAINVW